MFSMMSIIGIGRFDGLLRKRWMVKMLSMIGVRIVSVSGMKCFESSIRL